MRYASSLLFAAFVVVVFIIIMLVRQTEQPATVRVPQYQPRTRTVPAKPRPRTVPRRPRTPTVPKSMSRADSTSRSMSFEDCLSVIAGTSRSLGVTPISLVDTNVLRMVRYQMNDGSGESVLMTCSRPDRRLVITRSKPD